MAYIGQEPYDDGLTKWKSEMVDPVKTKWPKDNSGPK